MSEFETHELAVCVVCRFVIAYGEYDDGTDAAEVASAGIARIWGDDARHLISGSGSDDGYSIGYSTSSCDACGNTDHSDRWAACALIPKR